MFLYKCKKGWLVFGIILYGSLAFKKDFFIGLNSCGKFDEDYTGGGVGGWVGGMGYRILGSGCQS